MTLTDFLLARIAEDEERAKFVQRQIEGRNWRDPEPWRLSWEDEYDLLCIEPSRVLAECEAKETAVRRARLWLDLEPDDLTHSERVARRICQETLSLLALPYADHPDYDPAWRP